MGREIVLDALSHQHYLATPVRLLVERVVGNLCFVLLPRVVKSLQNYYYDRVSIMKDNFFNNADRFHARFATFPCVVLANLLLREMMPETIQERDNF